MSEPEAQSIALGYALAVGFQNAQVTESELVTPDELRDDYNITVSYDAECYWYVKMSGLKVNDRWPPGMQATPTPGTANTYTTMKVVLGAVDGYLAARGFATDPIFTPNPPTPGLFPTMAPFPTLGPVPATPPTS